MKKLIIYYAGEWAEKLLTIERYKETAYFIEDEIAEGGATSLNWLGSSKPVFTPDVLDNENPEEIIIIISNNLLYNNAKRVLENKGLIEGWHFFNGWKLEFSFYKRYYENSSWINYEKKVDGAISQKSFLQRTSIMAELIPEDVKSIMDIGCGVCELKKYLAPDIEYYGLDLCEREGTDFVCDINKEQLPYVSVDMYYMAGLLYYVDDLDKFISQMKNAKYILFDYGGIERYLRLDGVPADPLVNARNNYIEPEKIFNILRKHNFSYETGKWDWHNGKIGWHIYLFKKIDM